MIQKICARSLEKILPNLDLTNEENSSLILHSGDISSITVGNFKSYGAIKIPIIEREYKKHINSGCNECEQVYMEFLEDKITKKQSIEDIDKKYLNLWG